MGWVSILLTQGLLHFGMTSHFLFWSPQFLLVHINFQNGLHSQVKSTRLVQTIAASVFGQIQNFGAYSKIWEQTL